MVSKISVTFLLAASFIASACASSLDERQSCIPRAENCVSGTCCAGLFCSTTAPHICSSCIPNTEFCTGVPCCAGLFCGVENQAALIPTPLRFAGRVSRLGDPGAVISRAAPGSAAPIAGNVHDQEVFFKDHAPQARGIEFSLYPERVWGNADHVALLLQGTRITLAHAHFLICEDYSDDGRPISDAAQLDSPSSRSSHLRLLGAPSLGVISVSPEGGSQQHYPSFLTTILPFRSRRALHIAFLFHTVSLQSVLSSSLGPFWTVFTAANSKNAYSEAANVEMCDFAWPYYKCQLLQECPDVLYGPYARRTFLVTAMGRRLSRMRGVLAYLKLRCRPTGISAASTRSCVANWTPPSFPPAPVFAPHTPPLSLDTRPQARIYWAGVKMALSALIEERLYQHSQLLFGNFRKTRVPSNAPTTVNSLDTPWCTSAKLAHGSVARPEMAK
ncbi:hypothetical protein B0H16DRAFT_1468378 [Mycena metata]|uniref:Uncharacterized protein n=1 Tax=Mycena metata TaxID=1033252 RepID=A0AAD7MUS6_9AGAR|nr:hypothetical protein B0H16DRAFT_1468378 [Mycena metata]